MKSVAAATLFASVVLAESGLIPSGISNSCSSYLAKLNTDTSLSGCTSSIITATSAFTPSINASATTSPPSAAAVKSALSSLCSSTACSASTLRPVLADFYQACSGELMATPNKDVIALYDSLYVLPAFNAALCAKNDDNSYCATSIGQANPQSSDVHPTLAQYISIPVSTTSDTVSRRADAQVITAVKVNVTTLVDNNLLFMGLTPDLSSDKLCTKCTRNILTSYIAPEATTPYAPGLANAVFLAGQTKFYQGVLATCGQNFLTQGDGVAAAAGLSGGVLGGSNGALQTLANSGQAGLMIGALAALFSAAF